MRDRAKAAAWKDVELVDGDWTDGAAIARALEGVEAAYVMMPPIMAPSRDFREAKAVIAGYRAAFAKAPPRRALVALSSWGSERTSGLGMITSTALMEQSFRELPFPVTFLRAGGFYENFLYGLHSGKHGVLPTFNPPDLALPFVATDDIGREIAKRLTGPAASGVVELGTMITTAQIAKQLGEVLGRDVVATQTPRADWAHAMEHIGIPKGETWAMEEAMDGMNSGWFRFGVEGTERVEATLTARDVFAAAGH